MLWSAAQLHYLRGYKQWWTWYHCYRWAQPSPIFRFTSSQRGPRGELGPKRHQEEHLKSMSVHQRSRYPSPCSDAEGQGHAKGTREVPSGFFWTKIRDGKVMNGNIIRDTMSCPRNAVKVSHRFLETWSCRLTLLIVDRRKINSCLHLHQSLLVLHQDLQSSIQSSAAL